MPARQSKNGGQPVGTHARAVARVGGPAAPVVAAPLELLTRSAAAPLISWPISRRKGSKWPE